jgi:HAD superfamily hydrolase (TIGR01509 family)
MIKLVIFDLDGVLYDSKEIHFIALNKALSDIDPELVITEAEHLKTYDGLPTNKKLNLLTRKKNLDAALHQSIWEKKQEYTQDLIEKIQVNNELIKNLKRLNKNTKIACASNSIKKTVDSVLKSLGIFDIFDVIYSNQDVDNPKPHPQIYWKCMVDFNVLPTETIIVEDSPIGRQGASMSGANTMFVNRSSDLDKYFFDSLINYRILDYPNDMYENENLNVLIPLAGRGSRFSDAGYIFPKPLIEINGKPMIQVVIENLNIKANYIFIIQKEHDEKYNLKKVLEILKPNCKVVYTEGVTEGAACTTLLAEEFIDNEHPLLIANSDQFINWDQNEAMYYFTTTEADGGILTFESSHPKWSYARLDDSGMVDLVAEKEPISKNATVGVYYWKHGADYVKYANQMIDSNKRVNDEFYVCPVYNEAINDGKKILIKNIDKMWGIGTPEDLNYFLSSYDTQYI